jgi:hypothetical protein
MRGFDPAGRARVKLEVESCPPGAPFGSAACAHTVSDAWSDAGTTGVPLTRDVAAAPGSLRRWRVRTLRAPIGVTQPGITAPPHPGHGPWRRIHGQLVEGDIRTANGPLAVGRERRAGSIAIEHVTNPARGTIAFTAVLPGAGATRVEVFDVTGRRVLAEELGRQAAGRMRVEASALALPAGVYLLRVRQGAEIATGRLVVEH